ncbi:fibronectin type III domain-containing protein [Desulfofundulus salinus]|uniref:Fibronectin type III domain-containing protein n=1 Tax=Desulfofundulus salinus TaxID=2419843 RepID=A0A494WXW8_9FIRM|nr:fibronectin type III domain-containing protein [Desulfofundulus salinum]RKO67162.1 fibronectin type III domain-containing protein [Desulfofundulus salinum]
MVVSPAVKRRISIVMLAILALSGLFLFHGSAYAENFTNVSVSYLKTGMSYDNLQYIFDTDTNTFGHLTMDNVTGIQQGDLLATFSFDPVFVGTVNIYTGIANYMVIFTFTLSPPANAVNNLRLTDNGGIQYTGSYSTYNYNLIWDGISNASGYNVYRDGTLVGNTTSTTYTVPIVGGGAGYVFEVAPIINGQEGPRAKLITSASTGTGQNDTYVINGQISQIRVHDYTKTTLLQNGGKIVIGSISYGPPAPSDPVTNLQVINITKTSATATWTVSNAQAYKVYLDGTYMGTTTGNQYDFTNLQIGSSHTVTVVGVIGNVEGQGVSTTFTTLPPDPVTNLDVINITKTSATATWTGTPNASEYKVYLNGNLVSVKHNPPWHNTQV